MRLYFDEAQDAFVPERVTPGGGPGVKVNQRRRWRLQQDLKREIDRAATLEEAHREVEIDFVGSCEHGGRLGSRALMRLRHLARVYTPRGWRRRAT